MKNGTEHDMTQGAVAVPLIGFTIPLVLGNFFQLFYNAVDSIIVGRYVGESALAAVGTSTPVMNLVILLISGLCMGASILMSSQFGAGNYEQLSRQISTTLLSGCGFSIGLSVLTILLSEPLLRLIQVPKEVMPDALVYLRIIFIGILFTFIYNFLANTLRALGDSKTPLYFLVASAILNVLGDLLFVAVFGWGVAGSAISTVLSEASSCLFCALYIRKRVPLLCLGKQWFVFDKSLMKKTISYGSTSAMQQVCLQIGKTIIQTVVNTQGVSVMAAFTAVNRVDDFAYIPQQNIGHAMTTFIAQNKGAGKNERIRRGFQSGIGIELVYGLILLVLMYFGAEKIMGLFTSQEDAQVVALGRSYLHLVSWMYILPAMNTIKVRNLEIGTGMPKICVPIVGKTVPEILENAKSAVQAKADVVEWRVDWYEDVFSFECVEHVLRKLREITGEIPLLFTFRTLQEGGEQAIDAVAYRELNEKAVRTKMADLIDVELSAGEKTVKSLIKTAHTFGVKVVVSNHDFEKTPSKEEIVARLQKMQELGADLPKIAVMPQCKKDVLTLLAATEEMTGNYADRPIITMSMAKDGVISRFCGEVFGSALTFGAAGQTSAPGQIEVEKLRGVLEIFH